MRYGLCYMIVTNPDSKFKGKFKCMTTLLKDQHHMCARGRHDTILVERFHRFLNSSLTVFDNDQESNMVFIEGFFTAYYTWNSDPVATTDLSRSLLVVGREYHFPIDFQSRSHITHNLLESEVKSYAQNLTTLLVKSREIYKILIEEHRAMHREIRIVQLKILVSLI